MTLLGDTTLHPFDQGTLHFREALGRPLTDDEWDYFVAVCGLPGTWPACKTCGKPARADRVCECGTPLISWAELHPGLTTNLEPRLVALGLQRPDGTVPCCTSTGQFNVEHHAAPVQER